MKTFCCFVHTHVCHYDKNSEKLDIVNVENVVFTEEWTVLHPEAIRRGALQGKDCQVLGAGEKSIRAHSFLAQ